MQGSECFRTTLKVFVSFVHLADKDHRDMDLFQNDATKRRRSCDKTSLLAKELASVLFTYYLTCKDGQCSSHARPGIRGKRSRVAGSVETADGEVVEGPVPGKIAKVVGKQGRTNQSLVVVLGSLLC